MSACVCCCAVYVDTNVRLFLSLHWRSSCLIIDCNDLFGKAGSAGTIRHEAVGVLFFFRECVLRFCRNCRWVLHSLVEFIITNEWNSSCQSWSFCLYTYRFVNVKLHSFSFSLSVSDLVPQYHVLNCGDTIVYVEKTWWHCDRCQKNPMLWYMINAIQFPWCMSKTLWYYHSTSKNMEVLWDIFLFEMIWNPFLILGG